MKLVSRQKVRQGVVAISAPVRRLPVPLARPALQAARSAHAVFHLRESTSIDGPEADFGDPDPPIRNVDVTTTVLSVPDGTISFRNQHAFDAGRRVVFEENIPFHVLPVALERLDKPQESHRNVAYLSNTWPTNFYHWMCLTLPLIRFYEAAEVELDMFYVGGRLTSWQRRSLELAGVSSDRIVTKPCRAETAHVAVSTRIGGAVSPAQVRWTRDALVPDGAPGGSRRLFVGRGEATTRRMIDEEQMAATLEREFGFEYVITSNMTLDEEIELFGEAEAVVAPYGAALTNVLFARPGTPVLELRAHDADFAATPAFLEVSRVLGHPHGVLRGEFVPPSGREISTDIKISQAVVLPCVEQMLAGS